MPKIASNFELGSAQPIDSRLVVENESNLSSLIAYEGLEVYIKSLKSKKIYKNNTWVDILNTKEEVEEIVEENSEEVETLKIATSENYKSSSEEEIPTTKAVDKIISNKNFAKKDELFSKNYNDLSNKPTIPSKVSDLTNDTGYITETYVDTAISNAITKVLNEEV